MGSCVSVHKAPESAMKLGLSVDPRTENLLIPSPVKEKSDKVNGGHHTVADLAVKPEWSPPRFTGAGSKDEAFFDSQPWLESDCEDDFLSVNGDFTPSRGSTPVHHKFSSASYRAPDMEGAPEKKKRLSDLFKESLRIREYDDDNMFPEKVRDEATSPVQPKSTNRIACLFGANSANSSERTEDKPVKSAQRCLPSLRSSRSFNERKKKTSPLPAA